MEDDFLSIILPDNRNNMFDTLRSNSLQLLPKIRNLVEVKNDLIFAYDPIHQSILVTRASSFLKQASEKYQIYSPTVTIYGDADLMRVNENTTKAVIRTDQCLFVMDLPHVYLCCMLPPTATNMTKTRLWLVRPHGAEDPAFTRVLQVRWHPLQPYQLLVLYNDNRLRLMDAQCQTILNILSLGRRPTSNPLSTVIPLGEHAVDFAFVWRVNENLNDEMETEQQIMLVRGNGDIFNAEITPDRAIKEHPLTISSGTTAFISENWSIMVMPCYPPIVVIVSDDFIYHFVLFESGNMKYLQMVEAIQKWESPPGECSGRGCTDYIVKDTASMSRYFIVSHAGILTVIIPTLDSFTDFWKGYPEVATPGQESTKELLTKNTSKMEMVTSKDLGEPSHLHLFGLGLISGHRFTTHIVHSIAQFGDCYLIYRKSLPVCTDCGVMQLIPTYPTG
ncbi:uncharacterized protein LOC124368741 isoform X1 [Homalodisca vitripennis]|uniref:uncharacterized protein LOC124368741 isoform X1 n=2 Tax=Homalodisca vitripennis TaxID=197043 RepID=UPI001EEBD31C|nr:uncharacterized protein LOC124368741 isoform X1 [Homalodisca vitripennis]